MDFATISSRLLKKNWLLPLHAYSSFLMTGVICFAQFVYFPLFRYVDAATFLDFHTQHILRITPFVGAIMLLELLTALGLFLTRLHPLWIMNFFIVICLWVMTGFWQGPIETALSQHHDIALVDLLIKTNIWRVIFWVLHSLLVLSAMIQGRELTRRNHIHS